MGDLGLVGCTSLPELDVEQWGIREVSQTLNVEDLLDLGSTLYQWFHWFGLNIELWWFVKDQTDTKIESGPTQSLHSDFLILPSTVVEECVQQEQAEPFYTFNPAFV